MNKWRFTKTEKLLNLLGIYNILNKFVDQKLIKNKFDPPLPKYYSSDLFKYSTTNFLIRHFGGFFGYQTDKNTGDLGYGFLHYSFIKNSKPERVLCIGSREGYIPAICAMACKDNNFGHVDFIDAGYDQQNGDKNHWGGTGFWKKVIPNKHFSPYDLNKYITTYVTTSQKFASKYPKRKYEYIWIDADHTYNGVKSDYQTFWPRLAQNGMISFHDINMKGLSDGEEFGVWKLWQEIKSSHKLEFINGHDSIGFIQKYE